MLSTPSKTPGMEEYRTSARIKGELSRLGIPWENFGETGVAGYIGDRKKGNTVALRADMDALKVNCCLASPWPRLRHMEASGFPAKHFILIL